MADFVKLPIEASPIAMLEEWAAEMEALIEGWDANLAEYETINAQAIIYRLVLPLIRLAAEVDAAIFNEWGRQIVNVVPQEATRATVATTWTMPDTAGYTIPAGTQVDLVRAGDERVGFLVLNKVVIPPGSAATSSGGVILEAVEPGVEGNELEGEAVVIDALFFNPTVVTVGASSGGTDAEDPSRYLARLARTMQTLIEGVVIARDVATIALNVPGIGRALVLDNYNAETDEDEQEKTTTVAVTDDAGEPAAVEAKALLKATLEGKREVNYLFFVIDPVYHLLDVEGVVVPMQGFDKDVVAANAAAAIRDRFSPARHGQQPPGDAESWVNDDTLHYQDLVTVVNNAEGVDYYTILKWRFASNPFAAADIVFTDPVQLPKPDSIVITA